MERASNKARTFEEAARWEREQMWAMTPDERLQAAQDLRLRVFGVCPDVRESERQGGDPSEDLENLPRG